VKHEMVVRLTDDEYTALTAEARENGQELEDLIQDLLDEIVARRARLTIKSGHQPTRREISEILYYSGLTERIPSGKPRSAEEEAELERLGNLFGQAGGKSASEMVIEDRGPY
jgi:hypothetical protein